MASHEAADPLSDHSPDQGEARAGAATAAQAAREMLDAFAGVGADRFDLTFTDAAGMKAGFRRNRPVGELRQDLPAILDEAGRRQHNIIVRPRSAVATLIQLDDLDEESAARLRPVSFLIVRTSPGNHQAWLAVTDGDAEFARRLRRGIGADLTASGATRISGSMNLKEKYAPAYPRVETTHIAPGRRVTRAELEYLGVVAVPEMPRPREVAPRRQLDARGWPSYQRCLAGAPAARGEDRPDVSRADFTFCLLAMDWGWSEGEVAARLMQESSKAQHEGEAYAVRTAKNAAAAIYRRSAFQR